MERREERVYLHVGRVGRNVPLQQLQALLQPADVEQADRDVVGDRGSLDREQGRHYVMCNFSRKSFSREDINKVILSG